MAKDADGKPVAALVVNSGEIAAEGGSVTLSARAVKGVIDNVINTDGVIKATSVGSANGKIVLSGGDNGKVTIGGTVDASGRGEGQTGGTVVATGAEIAVKKNARVDASGSKGGGEVAIGSKTGRSGTWSDKVTVEAGATLSADAVKSGKGGVVTVLSQKSTKHAGKISARGGAEGGDGGFAEVSSHKDITLTGSVDLTAPKGAAGRFPARPGKPAHRQLRRRQPGRRRQRRHDRRQRPQPGQRRRRQYGVEAGAGEHRRQREHRAGGVRRDQGGDQPRPADHDGPQLHPAVTDQRWDRLHRRQLRDPHQRRRHRAGSQRHGQQPDQDRQADDPRRLGAADGHRQCPTRQPDRHHAGLGKRRGGLRQRPERDADRVGRRPDRRRPGHPDRRQCHRRQRRGRCRPAAPNSPWSPAATCSSPTTRR
ncbi:hypothetical protein [Azospirillum brasilense]|uniref:hypothetical protein n=1 Tax=Azospirillum brasilense TaxID=192 RepID=UPI0012E27FD5|nr:hypothetical protein [Azospirillum brasilense]